MVLILLILLGVRHLEGIAKMSDHVKHPQERALQLLFEDPTTPIENPNGTCLSRITNIVYGYYRSFFYPWIDYDYNFRGKYLALNTYYLESNSMVPTTPIKQHLLSSDTGKCFQWEDQGFSQVELHQHKQNCCLHSSVFWNWICYDLQGSWTIM